MATALDQIETAGGIAVPNFFNGRILSAEDLRMVMAADRRHRTLVGRALGPGIADGLRVSRASGSSVTVTAGVAVNRHGEVLDLPTNLEVRVAGTGAIGTSAGPAGTAFSDCGGSSPASSTSNAFLLTVRPDSIETGSAPADPYLTGASCGPGFLAEGVRFRRVPFDPAFLAGVLADTQTPGLGSASPRSRNVVSHLFLGSGPWTAFSDVATAGDVDPDLELAHQLLALQKCEVPLAVFYLQGGSVAELDEWAVRRPCRAATGDAGGLASFTSPLRAAAGTAAYLQFQAQLAELLSSTGPSGGPRLATHFRYLPAAGILPAACIGSPGTITDFLGSTPMPFFTGFSASAWNKAERPVRSARVEGILRAGAEQPPIDLVTTRGLPLTVVAVQDSLVRSEPYAVFVSAHHPYRERIDLDLLMDRLAAVEPVVDEEPFVTVAMQTDELWPTESGYRLLVTYRVTTNVNDRFLLEPQARKRSSVPYAVSARMVDEDGATTRDLQVGPNILTVEYRLTIGGVHVFDERRADHEEGDVTRSIAGEEEGESIVVDKQPSGVIIRELESGAARLPQFTFGLEVSLLSDSTVTAKAAFLYALP